MGKCKTKAFQTNGTFRHNQACPGYIQAYLEPCLTLKYLELWYIQNADTFLTRNIFRNLPNIYDEPFCENYDYFQQEFSQNIIIFTVQFRRVLYFTNQIINFFNTGPKIVILCKKLWPTRVRRTMNFWYSYRCIEINQPICC